MAFLRLFGISWCLLEGLAFLSVADLLYCELDSADLEDVPFVDFIVLSYKYNRIKLAESLLTTFSF